MDFTKEKDLKAFEKIKPSKYFKELLVALEAAKEAGDEILRVKASQNLDIQEKEDTTFVTLADKNSNEIIGTRLNQHFPNYGLLSEEKFENNKLDEARQNWISRKKTWIIDPLDGTNNFCKGGTDYGIHIGLTDNGEPVLGVNFYPETGITYFAAKNFGAYKIINNSELIRIRVNEKSTIKSFIDPTTKNVEKLYEIIISSLQKEIIFVPIHSCGLRICTIAETQNNLFISEGIKGGIWDFCSADIIIKEAGGFISDWDGNPVNYRNPDLKMDKGCIVASHKSLYKKALELLKSTPKS